eukprot:8783256-Pyramimonas_sp.AAC.1
MLTCARSCPLGRIPLLGGKTREMLAAFVACLDDGGLRLAEQLLGHVAHTLLDQCLPCLDML